MRNRILIAIAFALAIGLAWLLSADRSDPSSAAAGPARRTPAATTERSREVDALLEESAPPPAEPTGRTSAPSKPVDVRQPAERSGATLRGFVVDGSTGEPLHERTEVLVSLANERYAADFDLQRGEFVVSGLAHGAWSVAVRAPGFHPLLTTTVITQPSGEDVQAYKLWPKGWVVVRVNTPERQPYGELARKLGMEVEDVFEGGFRVWRSSIVPTDLDVLPASSPLVRGAELSLVSPHYDSNDNANEVARVRRSGDGPTWIALAFHSHFFGWAEVPSDVGAVDYEMALEDVVAQLGSLSFCVVDAQSEAAIVDAQAHLDAEVSGLRRKDTDDLAIDPNGCFAAKPLLPGEYDLAITAPNRGEHRQRVLLGPGQRLDLGEIELDFAAPLEIRVVDEQGQPVVALVQLGPWRPGARVDECITPRAWSTGDDGVERVPTPTVKSVVRVCRLHVAPGTPPQVDQEHSAFALFEPASRVQRLDLTLPKYFACKLDAPASDRTIAQVRIFNAFDLEIARHGVRSSSITFELPAGDYRAQLLDATEAELAVYDFNVPTGGPNGPIALY